MVAANLVKVCVGVVVLEPRGHVKPTHTLD